MDSSWIENRINNLEVDYLHKIFECRTPEAVEAAATFSSFLSTIGVTPENCSVYLSIFEIENRHVIDALVGDNDAFEMLSTVQPSETLLGHIFKTLSRWHRGGIHTKNLAALLGILQSVYASPRDGYRLYAPSLVELNALGKHLDKKKGQDNAVNRSILSCLDRFSGLENPDDELMDSLAVQATAIRNAFFDDRRQLVDVIPEVILEAGETPEEVAPRKSVPFKKAAAKAKK